MSTQTVKAIKIEVVEGDFYISTKHGNNHGYKPNSLMRDPVSVLKQMAQLLKADVIIEKTK